MSSIVRASSEGLASALPFAFSFASLLAERPLHHPFSHLEPLLVFQSPVKGLGWWEVARKEEEEGLREEEEQLDPLWYLLDSILGLLSLDRSPQGLLPDQVLESMFQRNNPCRLPSPPQLALPLSPVPHARKLLREGFLHQSFRLLFWIIFRLSRHFSLLFKFFWKLSAFGTAKDSPLENLEISNCPYSSKLNQNWAHNFLF